MHGGGFILLPCDTEDVAADLGHFETATEGRSACAHHKGAALACEKPWDGMRQAQGDEYWYRVVSEFEYEKYIHFEVGDTATMTGQKDTRLKSAGKVKPLRQVL